jgi:hypothetical protein
VPAVSARLLGPLDADAVFRQRQLPHRDQRRRRPPYVDGALKLDKWFLQGPTTYTVDVALCAGDHTLTLEYYENTGGATAKLSWVPLTTPPPPPPPPPPTGQLRRYWVKPDWLSPFWGYRPRDVAPNPAVNRTGEIDNRLNFRRARLNEAWQWFWADLMALAKYQRVYSGLTLDEKAFVSHAFKGLTSDGRAFTNNAGSSTRNCYPCGETDRGEDMRVDPLICAGNTLLGGDPVRNARGQWMVKMYSFNANQPPPVATLAMLDDPRVLWATIISTKKFPDGSYSLFRFPQLKDGTDVPYPYMTVEDYYYPLEELEEYPLTDPNGGSTTPDAWLDGEGEKPKRSDFSRAQFLELPSDLSRLRASTRACIIARKKEPHLL